MTRMPIEPAPREAVPPGEDSPDAIARDVAAVARLTAVPAILQVICQSTGMGFAAVARVTEGTWTACAVRDEIDFGLVPGSQLDIATTLCREVRLERRPIVIEHASRDAVYASHHTPRLYGLESYISVPIVLRDDEYFGNLCAIDRRPFPVSAPQVRETFRLFAEMIAGQLDDERRYLEVDDALSDERATAELREQFIAILGHDLRSPLGAIAAIGEMLVRDPSGARVGELSRRLLNSANRMSSMIDDILDFARSNRNWTC
jgi:GAF domain-containing protein